IGLAGAFVGRPGRTPPPGLAIAHGDNVSWVDAELLADATVAAAFNQLLGLGGVPVSAHDAKAIMRALAAYGIDFRNLHIDTSIAAYLIDPGESAYLLEDLAL